MIEEYSKAFGNIFDFIFTSGRLANFTRDNFSNDLNTFRDNFEIEVIYLILLSVYLHIKLRNVIEIYVCKVMYDSIKRN